MIVCCTRQYGLDHTHVNVLPFSCVLCIYVRTFIWLIWCGVRVFGFAFFFLCHRQKINRLSMFILHLMDFGRTCEPTLIPTRLHIHKFYWTNACDVFGWMKDSVRQKENRQCWRTQKTAQFSKEHNYSQCFAMGACWAAAFVCTSCEFNIVKFEPRKEIKRKIPLRKRISGCHFQQFSFNRLPNHIDDECHSKSLKFDIDL